MPRSPTSQRQRKAQCRRWKALPDENKTGTKANNESGSEMRPERAGQGEPAIEADKPATPEMKSDAAKRPEKAEGDEKNSDKAAAAEKKSEKAESEKVETVGEPLAPGMIKLIQDEIVAGFKNRHITDRFARFQGYAIGKVNSSAGRYTGSELAGNCRLRWYDHLMRNMLAAPAEAERFTRELHLAVVNSRDGLAPVLGMAAAKLDFTARKPRKAVPVASPEQALEVIKQALTEAQVAYSAAMAPLQKSEIRELQANLVPVMCTQNQVGHTLADRGTGRRLCDLMEKIDRDAFYAAADALAPITDVRLLEQLKSLPAQGNVRVAGVSGPVAAHRYP